MVEERLVRWKDSVPDFREEFLNLHCGDNSNFHEDDIDRLKTDDDWLLSFITATSNNFPAAAERLINALQWRKQFHVNDLEALKADIRQEFFEGKFFYCQHKDLNGRNILWLVPARAQRLQQHLVSGDKKLSKEEYLAESKRHFALVFESMPKDSLGQPFTIICDATAANFWKVDFLQMEFGKWVCETSTAHFPNVVANILVFNMPGLLAAIAKIFLNLLSSDTRHVVKFLGIDNMTDFVQPSFLPQHMGGTDDTWENFNDFS